MRLYTLPFIYWDVRYRTLPHTYTFFTFYALVCGSFILPFTAGSTCVLTFCHHLPPPALILVLWFVLLYYYVWFFFLCITLYLVTYHPLFWFAGLQVHLRITATPHTCRALCLLVPTLHRATYIPLVLYRYHLLILHAHTHTLILLWFFYPFTLLVPTALPPVLDSFSSIPSAATCTHLYARILPLRIHSLSYIILLPHIYLLRRYLYSYTIYCCSSYTHLPILVYFPYALLHRFPVHCIFTVCYYYVGSSRATRCHLHATFALHLVPRVLPARSIASLCVLLPRAVLYFTRCCTHTRLLRTRLPYVRCFRFGITIPIALYYSSAVLRAAPPPRFGSLVIPVLHLPPTPACLYRITHHHHIPTVYCSLTFLPVPTLRQFTTLPPRIRTTIPFVTFIRFVTYHTKIYVILFLLDI